MKLSLFLKKSCVIGLGLLSPVLVHSQQNQVNLPPPYHSPSVRMDCKIIGWGTDKTPEAPKGFEVKEFANGFVNPRCIYVAPNGDVFIADAATKPTDYKTLQEKEEFHKKAKGQNFGSANRIFKFSDADGDGIYEKRTTFMENLNQPFGMLVMGDYFYVANTDGILRFRYHGEDSLNSLLGEKIMELPAGGYNNHWTRNLLAGRYEDKIYVAVGSASNNGEYGLDKEVRRANILVINPDGSGEEVYAAGLRNPVPMDWNPVTGDLWTAVNERDELGDELVPDYVTHVHRGGFYGWPYAYFGANEDPRMVGMRPDLVSRTIVPDIPVGSHTASLGMIFYKGNKFPERYRNGIFVAQHGSWNRSELSGYKVLFIPFQNGKPAGEPEDFLTGFIADKKDFEVHGRPTYLAELPDGSVLLSDDASRVIWQISYKND